MANKYANLIGTNLIKDEYTKINTGFDGVEADMKAVESAIENHGLEADPHDQYALDTDLATLESALEGHELDDTAHGIGAIAQAVDNLEQEVSSHKAENATNTKLGHIKTDNYFKLNGSGVPTVSARNANDLVFGNSTTPAEDLVSIPNASFYEGFVSGATGYPATYGSIFGFKYTPNSYGYSWQVFHGTTASVMYRRHATGGIWSAWKAIQEV